MQKAKRRERRKDIRLPKKAPLVVVSSDFAGIFLESEDMSLGGVLLRLKQPVKKGEEITLQFHLPNTVKPIEVKSRIANVRGDEVGVAFVDIEPDDKMQIWSYMISKER